MRKKLFLLSLGLIVSLAVSAQSKYDDIYYFPESESPDGTHFLPPPPQEGSPLYEYDLKHSGVPKERQGRSRKPPPA